jgi:hypothetical protein
MSLRDMFALADRGWTSAPLVWSSIRTWQEMPVRKSSAAFLLPAACLILFGAVQRPLYQILVGVSTVNVPTCRDIPSWYDRGDNCTGVQLYQAIGRDIEPAQMAIAEQLVIQSRVASDLLSISIDESQSNLWSVNATYKALPNSFGPLIFDLRPKSLRHWIFDRARATRITEEPVPDFFVAGLPAGTTTGVLRQHLMRLNSSISCKEIDSGAFPSSCPGDRPFTMSWPRVIDTDVRICVPENYTAFPWTLSRSCQELTEETYIDIKDTSIDPGWGLDSVDPSPEMATINSDRRIDSRTYHT